MIYSWKLDRTNTVEYDRIERFCDETPARAEIKEIFILKERDVYFVIREGRVKRVNYDPSDRYEGIEYFNQLLYSLSRSNHFEFRYFLSFREG